LDRLGRQDVLLSAKPINAHAVRDKSGFSTPSALNASQKYSHRALCDPEFYRDKKPSSGMPSKKPLNTSKNEHFPCSSTTLD
jgi:hypothetical protein